MRDGKVWKRCQKWVSLSVTVRGCSDNVRTMQPSLCFYSVSLSSKLRCPFAAGVWEVDIKILGQREERKVGGGEMWHLGAAAGNAGALSRFPVPWMGPLG